jgi:DNA-directed RNA polymerase III subunit RPC8
MFLLATIVDSIRIPAHMLSLPTLKALHNEIDLKYPNRVLMNVELVVCRYGDCLKITNGSCVPGDGGAHHECLFRLLVFRPFVEEVCLGKIVKSTPDGIQVSLGGFFQDIRIPAYWMLRPSRYDEQLGLWVWTPDYAEDDNDDNDNEERKMEDKVKLEDKEDDAGADDEEEEVKNHTKGADKETGEQFEMDLGAEIRFKVKSIEFTQVTNTAKGLQATTTTTAYSHSMPNNSGKEQEEGSNAEKPRPVRKRSTSVDLSDSHNLPASMQIVASICEDGLGLTSWWTSPEEE